MPLGEIFDMFAHTIPVHTAGRFWARCGGTKPPALVEQRWALLLHTLRCMDVTFDPAPGRGNPTLFSTRVIAHTRPCSACGAPFFGYRTRARCGCVRGRPRELVQ